MAGGLGWRRLARGVAVAVGVAAALVALRVVPAILLGAPEHRDLILWKQSSGRMVSSFAMPARGGSSSRRCR